MAFSWRLVEQIALTLLVTSKLLLVTAVDCEAIYESWNNDTKRCECNPGFQGYNCQMCTSTAVCQSAFGNQSGAAFCNEGLVYISSSNSKTYQCQLTGAQDAVLASAYMALQCDRNTQSCIVKISNRSQQVPSIQCQLMGCSFTNGLADVHCGHSTCNCGNQCPPTAKALQAANSTMIKATSDQALHLFVGAATEPLLSATCAAAACEVQANATRSTNSTNNYTMSTKGSTMTTAAYWGVRVAVYGLCVAILCLAVVCSRYGQKKLAARENSRRLSFRATTISSECDSPIEDYVNLEVV